MTKLWTGVVIAALCALPVAGRAGERAPANTAGHAAAKGEPRACAAPDGAAASGAAKDDGTACDEADYAAREQAANGQLAQFSGGDSGVYITTGAILAAVLIVLLLTRL